MYIHIRIFFYFTIAVKSSVFDGLFKAANLYKYIVCSFRNNVRVVRYISKLGNALNIWRYIEDCYACGWDRKIPTAYPVLTWIRQIRVVD